MTSRPDWHDRAACRGHALTMFFPEQQGRAAEHAAKPGKKVCAGCPVKTECLAWALELDDRWATLGGLTARERRQMRRRTIARPHYVCGTMAAYREHVARGETPDRACAHASTVDRARRRAEARARVEATCPDATLETVA